MCLARQGEIQIKHFWLIRHAESAWAEAGTSDFDRNLNAQGRADGKRMATRYSALVAGGRSQMDWLVTSAALRAVATSEYVAEGFGLDKDQRVTDPTLYNASPDALLAALRETPPQVNCVGLVAHNPGLTWLVNALTHHSRNIDNLPPLGSALFSCDAENWSDVRSGELQELLRPEH